jgi:hypothetical protein
MQRADFMGRHFDKRRQQIAGFIGDPSRSESGEVFHEETNPQVGVGDEEEPETQIAPRPPRPVAPIAMSTQPGTPGARETLPEGGPSATRDDRGVRELRETSSGGRAAEDAGATLPPEEETNSVEVRKPINFRTDSADDIITGPGAGEKTRGTDPARGLPSRRKKTPLMNPQVLAMAGIGAMVLLAILLVLFW